MQPATVLIISVAAIVLAFTSFAVYLAFGPPAKQLVDPFDEHED